MLLDEVSGYLGECNLIVMKVERHYNVSVPGRSAAVTVPICESG
jgi:hypothetical protein